MNREWWDKLTAEERALLVKLLQTRPKYKDLSIGALPFVGDNQIVSALVFRGSNHRSENDIKRGILKKFSLMRAYKRLQDMRLRGS